MNDVFDLTVLADLKVPGPTITSLTAPFWEAASQGQLLIQRCQACGGAVFYPREICPHCWSDQLEWEEASGQGTLRSYTIIQRPGHPAWAAAAPYTVGLIRLKEGPVMLSHILGDDVAIGQALYLAPTNIGGRVLPCFRPET